MRRASLVVVALLVGCSSSSDDDPSLADRLQDVLASPAGGAAVVDRLEALGVTVSAADLAGATPLCPQVDDLDAGDLATCRLTVGGQRFEVDVEFAADGSIQVVAAEVAP